MDEKECPCALYIAQRYVKQSTENNTVKPGAVWVLAFLVGFCNFSNFKHTHGHMHTVAFTLSEGCLEGQAKHPYPFALFFSPEDLPPLTLPQSNYFISISLAGTGP